jgi:hypothetical protein
MGVERRIYLKYSVAIPGTHLDREKKSYSFYILSGSSDGDDDFTAPKSFSAGGEFPSYALENNQRDAQSGYHSNRLE